MTQLYYKDDSDTWVNALDLIYPVHSIYMSIDESTPADLFGGTWNKEDKITLSNFNRINITESQQWNDISFSAFYQNGVVTAAASAGSSTQSIVIGPAPRPTLIGSIKQQYAPYYRMEQMVGVQDGIWIYMSVRPDAKVYLYTLFSKNNNTDIKIAGFNAALTYHCTPPFLLPNTWVRNG